jgi:hypothetical protein
MHIIFNGLQQSRKIFFILAIVVAFIAADSAQAQKNRGGGVGRGGGRSVNTGHINPARHHYRGHGNRNLGYHGINHRHHYHGYPAKRFHFHNYRFVGFYNPGIYFSYYRPYYSFSFYSGYPYYSTRYFNSLYAYPSFYFNYNPYRYVLASSNYRSTLPTNRSTATTYQLTALASKKPDPNAMLFSLPLGNVEMNIGGVDYYLYNDVYYRSDVRNNRVVYLPTSPSEIFGTGDSAEVSTVTIAPPDPAEKKAIANRDLFAPRQPARAIPALTVKGTEIPTTAKVNRAKIGTVVELLPEGSSSLNRNGITYFQSGVDFYLAINVGKTTKFVVVDVPNN